MIRKSAKSLNPPKNRDPCCFQDTVFRAVKQSTLGLVFYILLLSYLILSKLHSVGFQVKHAAMIGRLLNHIALCQLPSHVSIPPEVVSRARASARSGRVRTPTSVKERAEETVSDNVGAILDDAMKHMKLAQQFPGRYLTKSRCYQCQVNIPFFNLVFVILSKLVFFSGFLFILREFYTWPR